MANETTVAMDKECPFGIEARFCGHQETHAWDMPTAIKGELIFLCKLDNVLKDCPRFKEFISGDNGSKS